MILLAVFLTIFATGWAFVVGVGMGGALERKKVLEDQQKDFQHLFTGPDDGEA